MKKATTEVGQELQWQAMQEGLDRLSQQLATVIRHLEEARANQATSERTMQIPAGETVTFTALGGVAVLLVSPSLASLSVMVDRFSTQYAAPVITSGNYGVVPTGPNGTIRVTNTSGSPVVVKFHALNYPDAELWTRI